MTTKEYKVQDFGSQVQISAQMLERMDKTVVEQLLEENLRKDAIGNGYTEVSEPKVFWGEQAFRLVGNDENEYSAVACNPADEGAFFYAGAKMTVIDKGQK